MRAPATTEITLEYGNTTDAGYTPSNPHAGVDFSWHPDDNIYAPEDCTVTAVGYMGTAGLATDLEAGNHKHRMCHQSGSYVKVGDRVKAGQIIGVMGDTGAAIGPHLHWVMWVDGVRVNGMDYVNQNGENIVDEEARKSIEGLTKTVVEMSAVVKQQAAYIEGLTKTVEAVAKDLQAREAINLEEYQLVKKG